MKKSIYILLSLLLSGGITGCQEASSLLDREDVGNLYDSDVFRYPTYAMYFVNEIYLNLPGTGFTINSSDWKGAYLECATDNGEARNLESYAQRFNNGNWNANNDLMNGAWATDYAQIRSCNQFLTHYDLIELEDDLQQHDRSDLENLKAQVYFLRAYHYYDLLKRYGGVPVLEDHVFKKDDPKLKAPRWTFAETVDYIVAECDKAAALFRIWPKESDATYGRANLGAALTLKAKTLALAASPLFNRPAGYPQYDAGDPHVALWRYPSYDRERWKTAADALKEVIDLEKFGLWTDKAGTKTAYETYFSTRATMKETIFPILRGPDNKLYQYHLPLDFMIISGLGTPLCYNLPTYDLVKAYEMKNGMLPEQEGSGYRPLNQFSNRDPRLKATIWHDGSAFCGIEFQTWRREITSKKKNGKDYITGYSRTGFYLRKYLDVDQNPSNSGVSLPNCYPVFRYADVLLLYAECLNEYYDDPAAVEGNAICASIDQVRHRAEMPGVEETFANRGWTLTQDNVRQLLRNERRVEFAFEDYRFWDIRRWMIGPETQRSVSELDIILKDDDRTKVYNEIQIEKRAWEDRMNLMPLPQSEVNKNKDLIQNWGWSPATLK